MRQAKAEEEKREKEAEEAKLREMEDERDQKMKESISDLPDEPAEGEENITTISFRSADGTKQFQRRFRKHHKVKALYDYIISLGTEAGFEEEHPEFELMQPFPREVFSDKGQTLEAAKLCPMAKIYIREV